MNEGIGLAHTITTGSTPPSASLPCSFPSLPSFAHPSQPAAVLSGLAGALRTGNGQGMLPLIAAALPKWTLMERHMESTAILQQQTCVLLLERLKEGHAATEIPAFCKRLVQDHILHFHKNEWKCLNVC